MTRKIEIQIKNDIYEKLRNESVKYDMDIQSYISMVLEKYDYNIKEHNNYIEEKVKKPLKKILFDLESFNGDTKTDNRSDRVLLLPLKMYNKPLPKGFSKLIAYYTSKDWYDMENFYLITDGKTILGYLGLNINEEDAPYGRYLFIYGLNLYKEHQNSTNLNYITNFVKSVGRQNKCYSIDILLENSNVTYNQLKDLGFLQFTSTDIIKIRIEEDKNKININCLEIVDFDIKDIDKFVPVVRTEPFKSLLSQWLRMKENLEVYKNVYKGDEEEIEFVYIKQDKIINQNRYNYYTLLIKPEHLYEDKYIYKAFLVFKSAVYEGLDEENDSIVSVPRHINTNFSICKEDDILDTLNWLRKNNS